MTMMFAKMQPSLAETWTKPGITHPKYHSENYDCIESQPGYLKYLQLTAQKVEKVLLYSAR